LRTSNGSLRPGSNPRWAVGNCYGNALAETIIGLCKTEPIKPRKPWRTIEQVELATAEWVGWYNHHPACTGTAETCHRSNWRPRTTLNTEPQHTA
jgi:hypothetical protein